MTTTRKIAHNTIIQMVSKILSTILGLLAIGIMTRALSTEQFGWYITAISFLQFVGILIDFGMIPVTAQMLSEPQFEKTTLLNNLLTFRLVTAVLFFGIAPIIALFFPYPAPVKQAIIFLTLGFLAITISQIFIGWYQTKLRMHITAIADVLGRLTLLIGIWLFAAKSNAFIPMMWTVTAASVVSAVILYVFFRREIQLKLAYNKQIWRNIIFKVWPIALAIMFNVVYLKGDVLLLSVLRPQTEVALYGAAYRVLDVLTQSAMLMIGILLPLLAHAWSRGLHDEFRLRLHQAFSGLMLVAIPGAIGALMLATPIIELIAGNKYSDAGIILQILSLAVFGVFLGAIFGHTAVAINRQKEALWIYLSGAILTLTGYLIFIPRFGMIGAAWMSVFSELYVGLLLLFLVRHYTKEWGDWKVLLKIIAASLVMVIGLYYLPAMHVIFKVLIGWAVYLVTLFALRGISPATLKEILSRSNTNSSVS